MLNVPSGMQVFLACGDTDMRKSINGLAAVVQNSFELDPFNRALFVFCNRMKSSLGKTTVSGCTSSVWNVGISNGRRQAKPPP